MVLSPTGRAEVEKVATPELRGLDPSAFVPSVKVTLPPGCVVPEKALTVAVKVTDCPWLMLDAEVASVTTGTGVEETTNVIGEEVLAE
jgi:hypothetical protein